MGWWKKKTEKAAEMNGIVNLKGLRFACESRNEQKESWTSNC